MVSRQLQTLEGWIIGISTAPYLVIMFLIYWKFNREGATLLQTISYWGIFCTFLITQRIGIIIDRTDPLGGMAIRFVILIPIYIYALASKREE